jgi:hypothetical protein
MQSYTLFNDENSNLILDNFPTRKDIKFFLYLMFDCAFRINLDRKQILDFDFIIMEIPDFLELETETLQKIILEAKAILPTMHPRDKSFIAIEANRELKQYQAFKNNLKLGF